MEKLSMPKVSIILPSYNGSKYIRESIDSIQKQTYTNWELIIVDDCSEDDTLQIARSYEEKDRRISVIHNEINQKLPSALNIGFAHAKGQYLTWTSDDNMYLPEALDIMVKRLEVSDVPMVCANKCIINENGEIKSVETFECSNEELYLHNIIGACFLYRREILNTIGEYDTKLFCVEDYDYWLRIQKRYGKIERIDQVLYKYRQHAASLSFSQTEKVRLALIALRKKHLEYILNKLKNKKELLYSFYYEMLERRAIDSDIKEQVFYFLPELRYDSLGIHGKYIIFGAGKYGEYAFEKLGKKTAFFSDNNCQKVGTYKSGKKILSFEEMISMSDQYDILIAVYCGNVYELIHQLLQNGIKKYCTLQTYIYEHL